MSTPGTDDPKFAAALDLVRRCGAREFQIRYHDDEQPTVWMALARIGEFAWAVDAGLHPVEATIRLCERLVDGGQCAHCGRPAGLEPNSLDAMPMNQAICWYQFDPELQTFRRGCEGDT